jgi:hypothetical protein
LDFPFIFSPMMFVYSKFELTIILELCFSGSRAAEAQ